MPVLAAQELYLPDPPLDGSGSGLVIFGYVRKSRKELFSGAFGGSRSETSRNAVQFRFWDRLHMNSRGLVGLC
jgi:hypothetical protein